MDRINRLISWIKKRTVGRDIVIGVVLVAGSVVLMMGFLNYYGVVQVAKNEQEARLERVATMLSRRLSRLMADKNYDAAIDIMRETKNDLPGASIRLEDSEGHIIFFHDNPLIRPVVSPQEVEQAIEFEKQIQGRVRLTTYSDRIALVKRNTITLTFSIIAVLMLALVITIKIIIGKVMMQSLQQIQSGIRIFADGNYEHRIVPSIYQDVQPIVTEINRMAQFISNRTLQLQREISERRRTEIELTESRRKLVTLFQNLPGMAYRSANDESMTMLFVSEGVRKLTGYEAEQLIDNKEIEFYRLIHSEDREMVSVSRKKGLRTDKPYEIEYRILTASGDIRWVWEQGTGITNVFGEILALEGFMMDITSRRMAEEELRRLNEELEMRVDARTADLEVSNRALKESLKLIKETQVRLVESEKLAALGGMVAGMAHEINNPLGISVTAASYLDARLKEAADICIDKTIPELADIFTNLQESARIIRANIKRASELVSGFKKVAIDQSVEEKRIFSMKEYLDELMLSLRPELKKSMTEVVVNCPDNLKVDSYPGAFSQIITNLVINAVRHGFAERGKGRIELSVKQAARHLMVVFSDDGCGIPDHVLPKIFDPFFTTARGQGGSGLGLHVVFSIVTNTLKGDIHCDSRVNSGTRFIIRIPYSELGTTLMIESRPGIEQ
ncbi:PAS domain-containing sensor histidine kinase [bacterium]|nr:PAS domain-containing sensor histidine kinase [candidate division CSSED10-310 bacterium]